MRYENQGRSNPRVKRRYNPNRKNPLRRNQPGNNSQKPRRLASRNAPQSASRRFRQKGDVRTKKIQRNQKRGEKDQKKDRDDLDREMREYWVKTGSAKGKTEQKNVASQKMNEEMDDYWKKAKKEENQDKKEEKK